MLSLEGNGLRRQLPTSARSLSLSLNTKTTKTKDSRGHTAESNKMFIEYGWASSLLIDKISPFHAAFPVPSHPIPLCAPPMPGVTRELMNAGHPSQPATICASHPIPRHACPRRERASIALSLSGIYSPVLLASFPGPMMQPCGVRPGTFVSPRFRTCIYNNRTRLRLR